MKAYSELRQFLAVWKGRKLWRDQLLWLARLEREWLPAPSLKRELLGCQAASVLLSMRRGLWESSPFQLWMLVKPGQPQFPLRVPLSERRAQ